MQVTPLTDIPARPEPIFDNTDVRGVDFSVRRVLDTPILFEEETTFVRRPIQVGFFPCIQQGKPGVAINDSYDILHVDAINLGTNNIGMLVGRTKVQILEHIIGVLAGLGIDADVFLRSSVFPFRAVFLPTKVDCAQAYAEALLREDTTSIQGMRRTFTFAEPTRIEFENKRGSYAILLPDEGGNELIVDVMVSYPGAIGTQRARVKINDEVIQRYIAGARTPSYGFRRKLMSILDTLPVLQRIVNIDSSRTVSIGKKGIENPRSEYDFRGINIELLMHEVLDKLGAYGIPLQGGARFVGTVMVFSAGHGHDLSVMRAMQNGDIKTKRI